MSECKPIITQSGNATSVDWNQYDLTLEQAAQELHAGRNVIAREFEDYSLDDDDYSFPEVVTLQASDYEGWKVEDIIENIRGWNERFGRERS